MLKLPVVELVFENGDILNISNYSCITFLTAFSKVFEKYYM
jgi:hypothetical protein